MGKWEEKEHTREERQGSKTKGKKRSYVKDAKWERKERKEDKEDR